MDEEIRKIASILLPPAVMAMSGSLVRYLRHHRQEPFSWGEFLSGMVVSGFVGIIVACLCRGLNLSPWIASAIVAMSGYSAGQVLDYGQGILLRWLERTWRG